MDLGRIGQGAHHVSLGGAVPLKGKKMQEPAKVLKEAFAALGTVFTAVAARHALKGLVLPKKASKQDVKITQLAQSIVRGVPTPFIKR